MLTSEYPDPTIVLQPSSTTPPSVLSNASLPPHAFLEKCPKKRVASIDLRIGLNLLGQEGRKLLVEYITHKRQL